MSKIAALDLGDQWTGVALSDVTRIFAKPYITIKTKDLNLFLNNFLNKEEVDIIVLGLPKTMSGRVSEQTQKILDYNISLKLQFPQINWILWDERLSSKRASELYKNKKNKDKLSEHAVAAAFILDSYLVFLSEQK